MWPADHRKLIENQEGNSLVVSYIESLGRKSRSLLILLHIETGRRGEEEKSEKVCKKSMNELAVIIIIDATRQNQALTLPLSFGYCLGYNQDESQRALVTETGVSKKSIDELLGEHQR